MSKGRLGRMEVECGLSSDQIKEAVKAIEKGEAKTKEAKREMVKAQPEVGHLHCQKIHQSGASVSGFDPGREYRINESGGQVRIPAGL